MKADEITLGLEPLSAGEVKDNGGQKAFLMTFVEEKKVGHGV